MFNNATAIPPTDVILVILLIPLLDIRKVVHTHITPSIPRT